MQLNLIAKLVSISSFDFVLFCLCLFGYSASYFALGGLIVILCYGQDIHIKGLNPQEDFWIVNVAKVKNLFERAVFQS